MEKAVGDQVYLDLRCRNDKFTVNHPKGGPIKLQYRLNTKFPQKKACAPFLSFLDRSHGVAEVVHAQFFKACSGQYTGEINGGMKPTPVLAFIPTGNKTVLVKVTRAIGSGHSKNQCLHKENQSELVQWNIFDSPRPFLGGEWGRGPRTQ